MSIIVVALSLFISYCILFTTAWCLLLTAQGEDRLVRRIMYGSEAVVLFVGATVCLVYMVIVGVN